MNVTLTVPFAGMQLSVSGSPTSITKVASIIAQGLPTLDEMKMTAELAALCEASSGETSMGMGDGSGQEFVTGSYTLLMAIRHTMMRTASAASFTILDVKPRFGEDLLQATIVDNRGRTRVVAARTF